MEWKEIEKQARMSVMWGEEAEAVRQAIRAHGVAEPQAELLYQELNEERLAAIRSLGARELMIGGALAAVPVVYWICGMIIGFLSMEAFALTLAVGAYGVWKAVEGAIKFLAPSKVDGSVADMGD